MPNIDVNLEKKMGLLRQKYLRMLGPRIEELKKFVLACEAGVLDSKYKELICQVAHNLSGSGATYGFGAISGTASALEEAFLTPGVEDKELGAKSKLLISACVGARGAMTLHPLPEAEALGVAAVRGLPYLLIVDDDEAIRALVPHLLQGEGEFKLANSGEEALALMKERRPDIILLDDHLPNLSGMKFIEQLSEQKQLKMPAIIMLTANKKNDSVVNAFKSGVVDYISKPVEPSILRQRILGLIQRVQQKILIADDDPAIRELVGAKFASMGYHVVYADDGESAFVKACSVKPDVIILDRMMPGEDGLTVFTKLQKEPLTKYIPVLMLTAKRNIPDIMEASQKGARDYIVKPFKMEDVVVRVMQLLKAKRG